MKTHFQQLICFVQDEIFLKRGGGNTRAIWLHMPGCVSPVPVHGKQGGSHCETAALAAGQE